MVMEMETYLLFGAQSLPWLLICPSFSGEILSSSAHVLTKHSLELWTSSGKYGPELHLILTALEVGPFPLNIRKRRAFSAFRFHKSFGALAVPGNLFDVTRAKNP